MEREAKVYYLIFQEYVNTWFKKSAQALCIRAEEARLQALEPHCIWRFRKGVKKMKITIIVWDVFLSLAILGISAFHTLYSATHNQMFTVQETVEISRYLVITFVCG